MKHTKTVKFQKQNFGRRLQKTNKCQQWYNYKVISVENIVICMPRTIWVCIRPQDTIEDSHILTTVEHQTYRMAKTELVQQDSIHIIPQYNTPIQWTGQYLQYEYKTTDKQTLLTDIE